MEYTESQIQEFKAEFARRRRRQWLVTGVMLAIVLSITIAQRGGNQGVWGMTPTVWVSVFFGVILVAIVFSFRNWRCPACNGYLGRSTWMKFCPKCGVPLR